MSTIFIEPLAIRPNLSKKNIEYDFEKKNISNDNSSFSKKRKSPNQKIDEEKLSEQEQEEVIYYDTSVDFLNIKTNQLCIMIDKSSNIFDLFQNFITCIQYLNFIFARCSHDVIMKICPPIFIRINEYLEEKNEVEEISTLFLIFAFTRSLYIQYPTWFFGIINPISKSRFQRNLFSRNDFIRVLQSTREIHQHDLSIRHNTMALLCRFVLNSKIRLDDILSDIEDYVGSYLDDFSYSDTDEVYMHDVCKLHDFLRDYMDKKRSSPFIKSYGLNVVKKVRMLKNSFSGDIKEIIEKSFDYKCDKKILLKYFIITNEKNTCHWWDWFYWKSFM